MNQTTVSKATFSERYKSLGIFKPYYAAFIISCIPVVSLVAMFIYQLIFNLPGERFWRFLLISLIPCGSVALLIWGYGILKTANKPNNLNKVLGWLGFFFSLGLLLGGILWLMTRNIEA